MTFSRPIAQALALVTLAIASGACSPKPADPMQSDAMASDPMKKDSMAADPMKKDKMASPMTAEPMKPADPMASDPMKADPMKPADH